VLGRADDGRAVGLADDLNGVGGGALMAGQLLVEQIGIQRNLPEKGFWRRISNSPEGGGAIERGILICGLVGCLKRM